MRRALRRAWWAWTVATGVSLVPVALAQRAAPHDAPPVRQQREAGVNRPLEIEVELAWLADRLSFPYQRAAHVGEAGLEVRGYVPSATVRDHALHLARQVSPLPVVDRLHVHANLAESPVHCQAVVLQQCVAETLRAAFANQVAGMQASCNAQGQVTVTGWISSDEEKLAVSHQLRRIPGLDDLAEARGLLPDGAGRPAAVFELRTVDGEQKADDLGEDDGAAAQARGAQKGAECRASDG